MRKKGNRIFKGHSWLKMLNQKAQCTKCKLIRTQVSTSTGSRYEYSKDGTQYELLPDCK